LKTATESLSKSNRAFGFIRVYNGRYGPLIRGKNGANDEKPFEENTGRLEKSHPYGSENRGAIRTTLCGFDNWATVTGSSTGRAIGGCREAFIRRRINQIE
jgi:hypothetical protein